MSTYIYIYIHIHMKSKSPGGGLEASTQAAPPVLARVRRTSTMICYNMLCCIAICYTITLLRYTMPGYVAPYTVCYMLYVLHAICYMLLCMVWYIVHTLFMHT